MSPRRPPSGPSDALINVAGRYRAIVFGAGEVQAAVVDEELAEFLGVIRNHVLGFKGSVEQRQGEVPQVDLSDDRPRVMGGFGGN